METPTRTTTDTGHGEGGRSRREKTCRLTGVRCSRMCGLQTPEARHTQTQPHGSPARPGHRPSTTTTTSPTPQCTPHTRPLCSSGKPGAVAGTITASREQSSPVCLQPARVGWWWRGVTWEWNGCGCRWNRGSKFQSCWAKGQRPSQATHTTRQNHLPNQPGPGRQVAPAPIYRVLAPLSRSCIQPPRGSTWPVLGGAT